MSFAITTGFIYFYPPEKCPTWDGRAIKFHSETRITAPVGSLIKIVSKISHNVDYYRLQIVKGEFAGWGSMVSEGRFREHSPLEQLAEEAE